MQSDLSPCYKSLHTSCWIINISVLLLQSFKSLSVTVNHEHWIYPPVFGENYVWKPTITWGNKQFYSNTDCKCVSGVYAAVSAEVIIPYLWCSNVPIPVHNYTLSNKPVKLGTPLRQFYCTAKLKNNCLMKRFRWILVFWKTFVA